MNELTKDDYYEIEKVMDTHAGTITEAINRYCQQSMHWEAMHKAGETSPLVDAILALNKAYKRVKKIREKLERIRKNG